MQVLLRPEQCVHLVTYRRQLDVFNILRAWCDILVVPDYIRAKVPICILLLSINKLSAYLQRNTLSKLWGYLNQWIWWDSLLRHKELSNLLIARVIVIVLNLFLCNALARLLQVTRSGINRGLYRLLVKLVKILGEWLLASLNILLHENIATLTVSEGRRHKVIAVQLIRLVVWCLNLLIGITNLRLLLWKDRVNDTVGW